MKTKNTLALILALSLIFPFTACSNADEQNSETFSTDDFNYEAFVVESSLSASGVSYQVEKDIHTAKEKTDSSVPQTVTLTISGYSLEGTYSHSQMNFPNNYYKHIYYGRDSNHELRLDDSGQISFFIWPDLRTELRKKGEKELTEEECLKIAKDFILNTVSAKVNLDEYVVKQTEEQADNYRFVFTKYINGFATKDEARVRVSKNGYVYSYSSAMFGRISAADMPKLDQDKLTKTIEKKLDTIYQDVRGKYAAVKYEEPELSFTLLDDGTPAIYCAVTVRFEDGKGGSFGEMVSMIIT